MSWVMVGTAAVTVVAGAYNSNQQKKAAQGSANAAAEGSANEIAERQRQYDQTRTDQMPWLNAGSGALTQMQALNSGDFSSFKESPDYQFALSQGFQGLDRSAAKRGSLYSGGHSADLMKYGQGMAAQQYGTYYSRLSDLATGGNATATSLGGLGAGMANQIGYANQRTGDARASAYMQKADANSQFATGTMGALNGAWQGYNAQRGGR